LEQTFRYAYRAPVRRLRHRLVCVPPPVHGHQHRVDWGLAVSGGRVRTSVVSDSFANHVLELEATEVTEEIEFSTWAVVSWSGPGGQSELPRAWLADPRLLEPTDLTRPDEALRAVARDLVADGARGLDLAERACHFAHQALGYRFGATGVRTTAAEALAGGEGVCQDYAHVMLAVCRAAGMGARYVSGHLAGEGGSHAWVEVVIPEAEDRATPGAVAVAFDPTHDRRAGPGYLTVAVGRDYRDVAPTSGTFVGPGPGVLSTRKRLRSLATERSGGRAGPS
jgi:transglutaminase-like putative cysteine protease